MVRHEIASTEPMRSDGRLALTPATAGRLLSVNVGMPRDLKLQGRIVHSCQRPVMWGTWRKLKRGSPMRSRMLGDHPGQLDA
jgi:hypothetical protein